MCTVAVYNTSMDLLYTVRSVLYGMYSTAKPNRCTTSSLKLHFTFSNSLQLQDIAKLNKSKIKLTAAQSILVSVFVVFLCAS